MRFVDLPVTIFDQHTGVAVLDSNQNHGRTVVMAGDRVGRVYRGPRKPQTVRMPVEHYEHYTRQAEALRIPIADYIAYRIAAVDDLKIPAEVLLAHPGLLQLLPEHRRVEALREVPRLAARYEALIGADELPLDVAGSAVTTNEGVDKAA
jgi:hypothetical protein